MTEELAPTPYLPRLPREYYQGDAVIHWTQTTFDRGKGWLSDVLHGRFRELMLHVAVREGLFCPAYCLMQDHIHLFWMGLRRDTDQINGMAFLRTHLEPILAPTVLQPQAHDHVLREEARQRKAFAQACDYILNNPLRAGLVKASRDWQYYGAIVPGYPQLDPLDADYWPLLWRLYWKARQPDAGNSQRPCWKNG